MDPSFLEGLPGAFSFDFDAQAKTLLFGQDFSISNQRSKRFSLLTEMYTQLPSLFSLLCYLSNLGF